MRVGSSNKKGLVLGALLVCVIVVAVVVVVRKLQDVDSKCAADASECTDEWANKEHLVVRTGSLGSMKGDDKARVLTTYDELKSYKSRHESCSFSMSTKCSLDEVTNTYLAGLFKKYNLAVVYVSIGSGSCVVDYDSTDIDGDTAEIKYVKNCPKTGTTEMSGYLIFKPVGKDVKSVVATSVKAAE